MVANPPFSLDEWGREVAEHDGFGRFRFGIPPKTKGDLAFVQHMIATANMTGVVGVVMPHGVLFRGAAEGEIRKGMLQEDLVEAVIGLPSNLFYGTGIPASILVLNRGKAPARRRKVLFIEASREFKEGSAQNYLREEDVNKIAAAFHAFKDVEKYALVVDLAEVEKNDFNLNISRYVETADAADLDQKYLAAWLASNLGQRQISVLKGVGAGVSRGSARRRTRCAFWSCATCS